MVALRQHTDIGRPLTHAPGYGSGPRAFLFGEPHEVCAIAGCCTELRGSNPYTICERHLRSQPRLAENRPRRRTETEAETVRRNKDEVAKAREALCEDVLGVLLRAGEQGAVKPPHVSPPDWHWAVGALRRAGHRVDRTQRGYRLVVDQVPDEARPVPGSAHGHGADDERPTPGSGNGHGAGEGLAQAQRALEELKAKAQDRHLERSLEALGRAIRAIDELPEADRKWVAECVSLHYALRVGAHRDRMVRRGTTSLG